MWVRAFGMRQLGAALLRQSCSAKISMKVVVTMGLQTGSIMCALPRSQERQKEKA